MKILKYYVGIPLHSNLGDQAQYYCISKWLSNNYSNFKVIEMPDILINSNFLNINKVIKKIINKEDIETKYGIVTYNPNKPNKKGND